MRLILEWNMTNSEARDWLVDLVVATFEKLDFSKCEGLDAEAIEDELTGQIEGLWDHGYDIVQDALDKITVTTD